MGKGLRNDFNTEFDPENSNYNYSQCTQQEGSKKRTAKRLCDKRDKAITSEFCRDRLRVN